MVKARRAAEDARRAIAIAAGNKEPLPSILYPQMKADYMWSKDFIQYSRAVVNWAFEYGVLVWLYNDNSDAESFPHTEYSNSNAHWEGMSDESTASNYGRPIVEDFGLAEDLDDADLAGFYRVTWTLSWKPTTRLRTHHTDRPFCEICHRGLSSSRQSQGGANGWAESSIGILPNNMLDPVVAVEW